MLFRSMLRFSVMFISGFAMASGSAFAEEPFWPAFHGPHGDNISSDTGLLTQWPDGGPKLVWTAEGIGHGFAGVVIADGVIYTAGNLGENTVITALDLDGRLLWQAENGEAWTSGPPGTRATPTIDGERLYHKNPRGQVICLDVKKGKKLWSLNILEQFQGKNIIWALAESVMIDGDRAICSPGGEDASVVALDKLTGDVVWKTPSTGDQAGYATATLAECQGLRMILAMTGKALIGVRAEDGELLFRHEHETKYDVNATKPLYHDGHVFISSGYGTTGSALLKINVDGDTASAEEVWRSREMDNHHGGVVLYEGHVYGAADRFNRAKWICLDWKTGEMKYAERGVGKGSLTMAEGMLYTMNENRQVGLVRATPDGHQVISQFEIPEGGKDPTWAHPVVCGGRLYIRHDDRLFAYDVRAE